jgi:phage tail-like protein
MAASRAASGPLAPLPDPILSTGVPGLEPIDGNQPGSNERLDAASPAANVAAMTEPGSPSPQHLTMLASELTAVARRHDPSWTGTSDADPGIALLELQAWMADLMSGYQDRIAAESRLDPYRNFKFRVKWDGRHVPGIIRLAPLGWRAEVVDYRDGADPNLVHHLPGRIQYEAIVLLREVTGDTMFEAWADQVRQLSPGAGQAGASYRKNIRVELVDAAGRIVLGYDAFQCWPSGYRVVAGVNEGGRGRMREELTLSCEGWQRDVSVVWPAGGG